MTLQTIFQSAAGQDAAEYLETYAPPFYDAVQTAVKQQHTPEDIYRQVLREVGEQRKPLALRCRQMAAWLVEESGEAMGAKAVPARWQQ